MKNQYFGDVNDYRKYGLLRSIAGATGLPMAVAWMLTPEDGSTDGKFTAYLDQPRRWSHHDPELFAFLRDQIASGSPRHVGMIEASALLPATYYSDLVPEDAASRNRWSDALRATARNAEFVFLDPDNGLEVRSAPYGTMKSPKYLYWREVELLWGAGNSLLIYQHFIREKRSQFIQRMLLALESRTLGSTVEAFATAHVVFLIALQPQHAHHHTAIVNRVQDNWQGQIRHWDLIR